MKTSRTRLALAGRSVTVMGAAVALLTGAAITPVASAEEAGVGALVDTALQTLASGSAQQVDGPRVTVSATTLTEDGEHEITVSGTGFKDDSVVASRPPLAGKNPGIYVILGKFADEWQPSAGAVSSARKVITQYWAVDAEDMATIGGALRGAIELGADGSFSTTFTVSKALVDEVAGGVDGNLGIYTYAGGGATHAAWETYTPITFGDPFAVGSVSFGSLVGLLPS